MFVCHALSLRFDLQCGSWDAVSTLLNQIPLELVKASLIKDYTHGNGSSRSSALAENGGHMENHLAESEPSEMAPEPYALKITSLSFHDFQNNTPKSS